MSRATVLRSMSYRYSPLNCFLPGTIFMLWLTHSQNAITRTAPMTAWRMWLVTQMSDHAQCVVSPASQAWLGNSGRESNEPTPNVGGAFPSSGRNGVASRVTLSLSSRVRPGGPLGRPVSLVDEEDPTYQVVSDPADSSVQQRTRQNVTQRSVAIAGFTSSFAHGTASLAVLNWWVISRRIGRVEDRHAQRAGHQDQSREPSYDAQHDPCEEPAGVQGGHEGGPRHRCVQERPEEGHTDHVRDDAGRTESLWRRVGVLHLDPLADRVVGDGERRTDQGAEQPDRAADDDPGDRGEDQTAVPADEAAHEQACRARSVQGRRHGSSGPWSGGGTAARILGMTVSSTATTTRPRTTTPIHQLSMKPIAIAPKESTDVHRYMRRTALVWECPSCRSRWCRCFLSGRNHQVPAMVRRTYAKTRSCSGSARTASGSTIGRYAASRPPVPVSAAGSSWPLRLTVEVASRTPRSIAPASPIKILAGKKLWPRNPMHTPAATTVTRLAVVARTRSCSTVRMYAYPANASEPIATTPAARPSRPSTKLMAFAQMKITTTVTAIPVP